MITEPAGIAGEPVAQGRQGGEVAPQPAGQGGRDGDDDPLGGHVAALVAHPDTVVVLADRADDRVETNPLAELLGDALGDPGASTNDAGFLGATRRQEVTG